MSNVIKVSARRNFTWLGKFGCPSIHRVTDRRLLSTRYFYITPTFRIPFSKGDSLEFVIYVILFYVPSEEYYILGNDIFNAKIFLSISMLRSSDILQKKK